MKVISLITLLAHFSFAALAEEQVPPPKPVIEQVTSEEARGKCSGSERLGLDVRMQNESFCSGFNDKMSECRKNMDKCEWRPESKACLASNDDNQEHMNKCSRIWSEDECKKDSVCKWDYKKKGCNAKDQSKKQDVDHCENFDISEGACNSNSQCTWGSL
jgi:hypothetical protein